MLKRTLLLAATVVCALQITPTHAQMSAEMKASVGLFEFDVSALKVDGNGNTIINFSASHGRPRTPMSVRSDWQVLHECAVYCDRAASNIPGKNGTRQHARSIIDGENYFENLTSGGDHIPVGCRCGIGGY
jgi:hypothetical protein